MEAGQIDWDLTFKAQRQQKLCTLYAGVSLQLFVIFKLGSLTDVSLSVQIEAKVPELRLFQNGWATEFLVKEIFHGHKCYSSRKGRRATRITCTTTNSDGPRRPQPPQELAEEDEEPRPFTISHERDNDGEFEALYSSQRRWPLREQAEEGEELTMPHRPSQTVTFEHAADSDMYPAWE
jgi:hypothetical protein